MGVEIPHNAQQKIAVAITRNLLVANFFDM